MPTLTHRNYTTLHNTTKRNTTLDAKREGGQQTQHSLKQVEMQILKCHSQLHRLRKKRERERKSTRDGWEIEMVVMSELV